MSYVGVNGVWMDVCRTALCVCVCVILGGGGHMGVCGDDR